MVKTLNVVTVFIKLSTEYLRFHCKADLLFDWFGFDQTSKAFW